MSKIINVRNSIKKIKQNLELNELSCIFFNNNSYLYTSLEDDHYYMSHDEIFDKINNIRCSSCTDFSKIETSLENLESINNFTWENTISILISDGHHTVDNFRSVDYVKEKFNKKFDYCIGIGHEFDSNLLNDISKSFLTSNDDNLFQFLFDYEDEIFVFIEKNKFFVTDKSFQKEFSVSRETKITEFFSNSIVTKKKIFKFSK